MNRGAKFMMMQTLREGGSRSGSGARNEYGNMRAGMENEMRRGSGGRSEMGGYEEMRNGNRWLPPYYDEGAQNNMDYGESRFRDRRGREHYDNGRFAPMRNTMGEGGNMEYRQTYGVSNNDGRVVDFEAAYGRRTPQSRQIGFERMENANMAYMGGGSKGGKMQMGGSQGGSESLDMETAKEWTSGMKNEDGTTGPHWTFDQAKQLMAQKGIKQDPIEFWAILNAVYSDYCKVAKKHNVNTMDFYVDIAKAWLDDEDAQEGKARTYFECIVK